MSQFETVDFHVCGPDRFWDHDLHKWMPRERRHEFVTGWTGKSRQCRWCRKFERIEQKGDE